MDCDVCDRASSHCDVIVGFQLGNVIRLGEKMVTVEVEEDKEEEDSCWQVLGEGECLMLLKMPRGSGV